MSDVMAIIQFWFGSIGIFSAVVGGGIGSAFRAIASRTQETRSIKTVSDVVIGAIFPVVLQWMPGFNLLAWDKAPPGILGLYGLGMGLSASWVVTWLQWIRRDEEPAVKNAAAPIFPAKSRDEGA